MKKSVITKKLNIVLIITSILLGVAVLLGLWYSNSKPDLSFSVKSGFYSEPFDLSIEGVNGQVYYTLDGSEPDRDSTRYDGAVHIEDASLYENTNSMNTDVSAGFYNDLRKQYNGGSKSHYKAPDFLVDKCTVVKAVCINAFGVKSQVKSASYFVDFDEKDGYKGVGYISLYTEPDNLFGDEKGIYVTGKTFKDYMESGKTEDIQDVAWWWWPANYRNKGDEWEREARIDVFDRTGQLILEKTVGVRTQGNGSRGMLPRSLNIYARETYDGTDSFGADLLNTEYENADTGYENADALTIFGGGNANITKINDRLISDMVFEAGLNVTDMTYAPYVLFVNGEYWGFYYLTEKYNARFLAEKYGVDESNLLIIRNDKLEGGEDKDRAIYEEDMSLLRNGDFSTPESYALLNTIVDMDSFLDYFALQIYISRFNDWPGLNLGMWKTKEVRDDGYSDGRWRYLVFDENGDAMNPDSYDMNTVQSTAENDAVFANLCRSELFLNDLYERLEEMAELFNPDVMGEKIDAYSCFARPLMEKELARFYGSDNDYIEEFDEKLEKLKVYFRKRQEYVKSGKLVLQAE